jgi:gas vesicle protein
LKQRKKTDDDDKSRIPRGGTMAKDDGASVLELSFAFVLGSLVGATIALLYAPTSGDQTRKRIREAGDDLQENVKGQYGRARDKAEIEFSRLKDRAQEGAHQAKSFIEEKRSKVKEAFQQGRRSFEEEMEKEEEAEISTPSGDNS